MIARSDRVVSHTDEGLGDEVRVTAAVRFDSPDDAASPEGAVHCLGRLGRAAGFLHFPGGFAVTCTVNRQGYISKQSWRVRPI